MKKLLILAAAAALLLASCAKVETNKSLADENIPIAFGAYAGRNITKATTDSYTPKGTTTFTATNQKIGVYAFMGTSTTANFMKDVEVTLAGNGATASQAYDPVKYWPKDETVAENALNFFAYYPYDATGMTRTKLGTSKYGSFAFTVQDAVANQVDLMVADAVVDQYYSTNAQNKGVVPFTFHHALTRVLFQMKAADTYNGTDITVTSLSVSKIKKAGTYTVGTGWGSQATYQTNTIPVPTAALTTTAAPADEAANVFLLLPQTIDADAELSITYKIKDTATSVETTNTKTVKLNTITDGTNAIAAWAANQNVVYTITIGLNPIKFTATISDWDAPTAGAWDIL